MFPSGTLLGCGRVGSMTRKSLKAIKATRDRLMDAAQKELIAFEQKERELIRRAKADRADEIQMPELKQELHFFIS